MSAVLSVVASTVGGAVLGYGYYRLVGCSTGMCPITAKWWTATLYGAVMGLMLAYR